ncbi:MAG: hypothetical protein AMXMBFR33_70520 [Candidatus Xenobia bacterium]
MEPSFAFLLRTLRREAGLTQKQLGDATNIRQRQISRFERDQALPTREQHARIARVLQRDPSRLGRALFRQEQGRNGLAPLPHGFLQHFGRSPKMHEPTTSVSLTARIHTAIGDDSGFETLARAALQEPGFARFVAVAPSDSSEEARWWVGLSLQGARFSPFTHARLGWEGPPIIPYGDHRCACGRLWPALYVERPVPMVFFPQVRIKTPAGFRRVDVNVAMAGKGFFAVEINGEGHRGARDHLRSGELGMDVVYLSPADVRSKSLVELVLSRLRIGP